MRKIITKETELKILELYMKNINVKDIAKELNVCIKTVRKVTKKHGIWRISKLDTEITDKQELELCKDYQNLISKEKSKNLGLWFFNCRRSII